MIETPTAAIFVFLASSTHAPPAKYDYPATNMEVAYNEPQLVIEGCRTFALVRKTLRGMPLFDPTPLLEVEACTFVELDAAGNIIGCTVVLPYGAEESSVLYRHAQAHCNGWPADHSAD